MSKQSAAYDAAAKPDGPRPAALPSLLTLGRDELTNLLTLVAGPESAERGVVGYAVALAEQLARLRHRGRVMSERPAPYDAAEPAPAAAPAAPSPWEPYAVIHLGDVTIPRALFSRLREAGFVFLTHSGALESGQVAYLIALGLAAHERGERAS